MHELAHIILGHEPATMFFIAEENIALRGFNKTSEDEADWLSGTLLLPRDALVHIRNTRMADSKAGETYFVSKRLLDYRMRMTGVDREFSRRSNAQR